MSAACSRAVAATSTTGPTRAGGRRHHRGRPAAEPAARRRGGAEPGLGQGAPRPAASFNDAQQIADRFKDGVPVIINLQSADQDLSKRLIDFASGLTYALDGGMQRVADKVFLLTPRNVEVSAEERPACSSAAASSTRRRKASRPRTDRSWAMHSRTFVDVFLWVYRLLLFAYILTSWIGCRTGRG
jgi:hypothetical protein